MADFIYFPSEPGFISFISVPNSSFFWQSFDVARGLIYDSRWEIPNGRGRDIEGRPNDMKTKTENNIRTASDFMRDNLNRMNIINVYCNTPAENVRIPMPTRPAGIFD